MSKNDIKTTLASYYRLYSEREVERECDERYPVGDLTLYHFSRSAG
jgi:hypothetical protein